MNCLKMDITAELKKDLIKDEGFRQFPYMCKSEKLTIGIGRNIDDVGISENEANFLLENDIKRSIKDAESIFNLNEMNQVRKEVIVNMIFNLGKTRFLTFKKTIQAIKDQDYMKAGSEMMDSKWFKQVGSRSSRLVQEMKSGERGN